MPVASLILRGAKSKIENALSVNWCKHAAAISAEVREHPGAAGIGKLIAALDAAEKKVVGAESDAAAVAAVADLRQAVVKAREALAARDAAMAVSGDLDQAKSLAEKAAAQRYQPGAMAQANAKAAVAAQNLQNGDYAIAVETYKEAIRSFGKAAYDAADKQLAETHSQNGLAGLLPYAGVAGQAWQQRVANARTLAENQPGRASGLLLDARDQIPELIKAAKPEMLKMAKGFDNKEEYRTALTIIRALLVVEPDNAEGQQLQSRLLSNYRFEFGHTITNSIGMKLAFVPGGEITIGTPDSEKLRDPDEKVAKVVISRGYFTGTHEVTQGQWAAVMGADYRFQSAEDNNEIPKGPDYPVVNVNWHEANEFCRKLGDKEGKTYRLPTEAEWERACRGGTTIAFNVGPVLTFQDANVYDENGISKYSIVKVGSFKPGPFGLYDMHGNVWEWCQDWYVPYPNSGTVDLVGTLPAGSDPNTSKRSLRGGSWYEEPDKARSGNRSANLPVVGGPYVGFRVLLDAADVD